MFRIGSIAAGMGMHLHGLKQLGGAPAWAIEYDQAIAQCYRNNHEGRLYIKRVQDVMPSEVEDVDLFIATPSCKNASTSKGAARGETPEDYSVAVAIAYFIRSKMPKYFFLENVWQYRNFQSFRRIMSELKDCGYDLDYFHLNCADWGVAQSRKRLYLVACRDSVVPDIKPPSVERQGWHKAISDLIPNLEKTEPTAIQRDLISRNQKLNCFMVRRVGSRRGSDRPYLPDEPSFTIRAFGRGCSNHWHQADLYLDGNLYALTPQVYLRFFGDKETADKIWLPNAKCLANEVVGNGASWIMFGELFKHLCIGNHQNLIRPTGGNYPLVKV